MREAPKGYKVLQVNTKGLMMRNKAQVTKGSHKALSIHIQLRGLMMSKLQRLRRPRNILLGDFAINSIWVLVVVRYPVLAPGVD